MVTRRNIAGPRSSPYSVTSGHQSRGSPAARPTHCLSLPSSEKADPMLVSVIIPAINEAENIQRTIRAARREYTADEVEIIVVDGGSTDGTPELVPPDARLIRGPLARAVKLNRGAQASSGEILLFCHADSQLPPGWREAVIEALDRPGTSGGCFQEWFQPEKGVLRWLNRLELPADWRLMLGDMAQFMSRSVYERVGGYPELPFWEDLEMSRQLHEVGPVVRIPLRVITSSRRFLENGPLRQCGFCLWTIIRYVYLGASPEAIAGGYRSSRERAFLEGPCARQGARQHRNGRGQ
jgi:rSAM/selenodomain-associated transferase 2